jgi:hypothetical protein
MRDHRTCVLSPGPSHPDFGFGQHLCRGENEHSSALETNAGYRDATEAIKDRPFLLVTLEVISIGGEAFEPKALRATTDTLAHLAADLAKAAPA